MTMSSAIPTLPLRGGALFPGAVSSFSVGRAASLDLARQLAPGDVILTVSQKDARVSAPTEDELYRAGTYARVRSIAKKGSRELQVVLEGLGRARLESLASRTPHYTAIAAPVDEVDDDTPEAEELARAVLSAVSELAKEAGGAFDEDSAPSAPGALADHIASSVDFPIEHEIELLAEANVPARLRLLVKRLGELRTKSELRSKIEGEVRKELGKNQRDAVLREQLRAIKKELGDGADDDIERLRKKIDDANLPDEAKKVAERELGRLSAMNGAGPEANVIRSYLELIADLPWNERADTRLDVDEMARALDADHYGLDDVKKRILEHVAVLKLTGHSKGTVLCLAGPPGVGKTSLGQSIADATGRPFVRVALGGVRDEAEIRGHRRTYVGALPGRILSAVRKAKVKNPVILLDEVDKLSFGYSGSPEAALLEVLDPEQNHTFADHYLELPFDLSEVMFICTANALEQLAAPLRDRLEVVEISGYTPDEKAHIARRHLFRKRTQEHGIADDAVEITDGALEAIVRDYTREAGVRQLDREIKKLCRALALRVVRARESADATAAQAPVVIDEAHVREHLGKPKYDGEIAERASIAGVATGLAWTPFGGSILFIETSRMPGRGAVEITGQLGDVMKESARAALSYVRSNADKIGIDPRVTDHQDVHIHVPSGAVPKDGPSAGVTIFTALTSLLTGRRVRSDTAMTGECTLRGRVLPVGGIKAKLLAAHRAGIKRVIVPTKCERDLDEVPKEVREALEIVLAEDMSDVLAAALEADVTDAPLPFRVAPPSAEAAAPVTG